jgi:hypothetical protein
MSRRIRRWLLPFAVAFLALGAAPTAVRATSTLNVPGDFATIQAAIDAAAPGDTVLIAAGTYHERIDFEGKAITVASASGPGSTVIDGGANGRVVNFSNGEGRGSILRGFTVRNGSELEGVPGAGIRVFRADPTIQGNLITSNIACGDGGGISVEEAAPFIQGNVITSNDGSWLCTGGGGGGISILSNSLDSANPQIVGNAIEGNRAYWGGGILLNGAGTVTIDDNVITGNTSSDNGGGIWDIGPTNAIVVQNLIANNRSAAFGGGVWGGGELVANTFAGNAAQEGSAVWVGAPPPIFSDNVLVGAGLRSVVYCDSTAGVLQPPFDHNDAFATDGGTAFGANCGAAAGSDGNVSADPHFAGTGDFHLQAGSPAIDAGNGSAPDLPATDLDGNPRIVGAAVDMGAYEAGSASATPAVLTFAPGAVSFGTVHIGSSVLLARVTLTNTGGSPLPMTADYTPLAPLSQTPDQVFSIDSDGCELTTLAPGASCVVQVGFLPSATGNWSSSLQVSDGLGLQTLPLTAAVVAGQASPSRNPVSFGTVRVGRQSKPTTVTITNTGAGSLHITSFTLQGNDTGDFLVGSTTCANATLAVAASCTVQVAFKPIATGSRSASLSIASDDPASPATVSLLGSGS